LEDGAFFHNLAHISGKTDRTFMKISPQMYMRTRKSTLNFGSQPATHHPWNSSIHVKPVCASM